MTRPGRTFSLVVLAVAASVGPTTGAETSAAEPALVISIEKLAQLSADGSPTFRVHVTCGPLPGSPDFRQGHAGAGQARTGAAAEGGLSPDVECDGTHRVYTASPSLITDEPFRPGPAGVSAAVIACNVVGDDQVCIEAAAQRQVIIQRRSPT